MRPVFACKKYSQYFKNVKRIAWALVDSLECYMDDLVTCFEDFVKKSLILISVGVGTVVAMLVYILKVLSDRSGTPSVTAPDTGGLPVQCNRSNTSIRSNISKTSSKRNVTKSDFMLQCSEPKITCTSANTMPIATVPSFDERVLRDIGFSNCNQDCELKKRTVLRNCSPSRISIPSLPTFLSEQHLAPRNCIKVLKQTSCCSMCCAEEK